MSSGSSVGWNGGGLGTEACERYARQLVLPRFGVQNQKKLIEARVLVVGAGGLGSPVCLYLAAAGVGTLGIVDQDEVDTSNLHRQVLHTEEQVGVHKALSAKVSIARINSTTKVETHLDGFRPQSALALVRQYDCVVDASDNPATRYCLNDACVIEGRPLVSAAAIGTDGQLSCYNYGANCPCYRCVWPDPPSSGSCQRCSDAGVLGVVPGIMGTLQALEAIKVVTGVGECMTQKLLMFDAMSTSFRTLKLRPKQAKCIVCGTEPLITADNLASYDYEKHCGGPMHDKDGLCLNVLPSSSRISCQVLKDKMAERSSKSKEREEMEESPSPPSFRLIDVRPKAEFDFASLPGSINLPMDVIEERLKSGSESVGGAKDQSQSTAYNHLFEGIEESNEQQPQPDLYVVCRRGNDSQIAVDKLRKAGIENVFDLKGGLQQWSKEIDETFPIY